MHTTVAIAASMLLLVLAATGGCGGNDESQGAAGPAGGNGAGASAGAAGAAGGNGGQAGSGGSAPSPCGDGICSFDETCQACEADCGACVPSVSGHVYHVAMNQVGASDSNDGLAEQSSGGHGPWLTVSHGAEVAQAGDLVLVHDGLYDEDVWLGHSGTQADPIRIFVAPGEAARVSSMLIQAQQWIVIRGFTVLGPAAPPPGWTDLPAVVVDHPAITIDPTEPWDPTRHDKVYQKYATYMAFTDGLLNNWSAGLRMDGASHIVVQNNAISQHTACIQANDGSSDLTIQGNTMHHCRDGFFSWTDADGAVSMSSSVIRGNLAEQNYGTGIEVMRNADSVVVADNVAVYNGVQHYGLEDGPTNCAIRHNRAEHAGYYAETMEAPGSSGINLWTAGAGNVVERNFVAYELDATCNDGNGIIIDWTPSCATVRNNVVYRNMGSGITLTNSPDCIVIGNTAAENGFETPDQWNGAGIRFSWLDAAPSIVANNILYKNARSGIYSGGMLAQVDIVDYNLYEPAPGTALVREGWGESDAYYSLDALRALGREEHGIAADPLLFDPTVPDYHLKPGSPAINAGDPSHTAPDDFDGVARDSAPDIGAFEWH